MKKITEKEYKSALEIIRLYQKQNKYKNEIEIIDDSFVDLTKHLSFRARNNISAFLNEKRGVNVSYFYINMDRFNIELLNLIDVNLIFNQRNCGKKTYYEIVDFINKLNVNNQ
jgi:hypothetical protein